MRNLFLSAVVFLVSLTAFAAHTVINHDIPTSRETLSVKTSNLLKSETKFSPQTLVFTGVSNGEAINVEKSYILVGDEVSQNSLLIGVKDNMVFGFINQNDLKNGKPHMELGTVNNGVFTPNKDKFTLSVSQYKSDQNIFQKLSSRISNGHWPKKKNELIVLKTK